jgi:nitroreductase
METWDAITSRRNVRSYEDRALPDEYLDRILEAARRTPSSSNKQRWDFIVCTDRQQLNELSKVWTNAKHVASSAATIALIAPVSDDPGERESVQYDLGQATMSIMLAATDLGIGSGHSLVTDHDLARRILRLPENKLCAWLIALGYPADRPLRPIRTPERRGFEDVVHRNHW